MLISNIKVISPTSLGTSYQLCSTIYHSSTVVISIGVVQEDASPTDTGLYRPLSSISRQALLPLTGGVALKGCVASKNMFQTRQQLGNRIYQHPHSAYAEAMKEVFLKEHKCSSVGFHSDVYYVRAALEKKTGFVIPLFLIEAAMKKEGWKNANA